MLVAEVVTRSALIPASSFDLYASKSIVAVPSLRVVSNPACDRIVTDWPATYSGGRVNVTRARRVDVPAAFTSAVWIDGLPVPNVPPTSPRSSLDDVAGINVP